ncbi:ras GTPase-activating-like protein IQGAP1 [Haemaphysalis longicornis]
MSVAEDVEGESRPSSDEMDERRQLRLAYLYLCHLEETRLWLSSCIEEELPSATRLEESLRNGVYLARLSHFFAPDEVPLRKIYDADQNVHRERGLCFRHTDNINHWLKAMRSIGFPEYFFPDPFDLYEKKNLPKVIYCLHALSLYLFKLGKAPRIKEVTGKLHFSDDEVEQVRRTLLTNSSVPMPAFDLIDGILAKETSADSSAVVAINTTIDRGESAMLLGALSTPSAQLRGVRPENIDRYLEVLERAKAAKLEHHAVRRFSAGGDEEAVDDMYERLLSLAEVQGYLFETNVNVLLGQIDAAVERGDRALFGQLLLTRSDLGVHDLEPGNVHAYYQVLLKIKEDAQQSGAGFMLARSDLQVAVQLANEKVREETQLEACIGAINASLDCGRAEDTLEALRDPCSQLPAVYPLAATIYHDQLAFIRREAGRNLGHDELVAGVRILNAIAELNFALRASGTFDVVACLQNPHAHIADVRPQSHGRYVSRLQSVLSVKSRADSTAAFLTHSEIQDVVNEVNAEDYGRLYREDAIDRINQAVASGSPEDTIKALLDPAAAIAHLGRDHVLLYQKLLSLKQRCLEGERQLSAEDVQNVVDTANQVAVEASDMGIGLATVNVGVCNQEEEDVRRGLESLKAVQVFCGADAAITKAYMRELHEIFLEIRRRASVGSDAPIEWFSYVVRPDLFFNLNVVEFVSEWSTFPKADPDSFLSLDDVQTAVLRVNERLERSRLMTELNPLLTRLQAHARGFLVRSAVRDQYAFYMEHLDEIIRIQSWFRTARQRRRYRRMLYELEALVPFVVRLQSYVRGYLAWKAFKDRREYYSGQEDAVIFVQSQYRAKAAIRDYRLLMGGNPSVPVLHKFLHMLDISERDLSEEMKLQLAKARVVATIRHNQELEKEALDMDVRIGLLVRNCITLEDVVKGHGGGKREKTALAAVKSDWLHSSGGGLTALSRRSRERLEAYQHLFYLLQVHPHYLAKLIFVMPTQATNNFVESVIYSVYNYGSTPRDEYLLLRLFRFALLEEVSSKLSKPSDILRGNPLVVRMVIGFFRTRGGHNCLEQLLSSLVRDVLEDKDLNIDLNPVDIYKKWVNDLETTSGKPSGLSYDIDEEQALQQGAVCKILHTSVLSLETKARMFARRISASKDLIPYGMRYTCKVLRKALEEKFPESSPEDISKVMGNILYYRYINPGIVAPDTFGVVQMAPEHPVTNLQRRNLGHIAKILGCASAAVPFNQPQHPYQMRLDSLIDSCGKLLHGFFADACAVPEPEDWFGVDSYSEATHITPPTITLTAMELRLTHRYLLEYRDSIAPDPEDPLHGLLLGLGPEPTVEDLVGESGGATADGAAEVAALSSVKISLSLYGKFSSEQEEDAPETDQLLRETKHMVVELLRVFQHVTTIQELFTAKVSPDLDRDFLEMQTSVRSPKTSTASLLGRRKYGSLEAFRKALQKNLRMLEDRGLASSEDDYQDVMNGIAGDILQQRNRRVNRQRELAQLAATKRKLDAKTRHYEETVDYYRRYVQACLANLASTSKSRRKSLSAGQPQLLLVGDVARHRPLKSRSTLKYTGARLHEKGILLEVSGLETGQLKNVSFEIAPAERAGVFRVRATFLGVSAEEVTIDIQDLLQRQYDGVAVTELSERARVNNNLLLFFLNKKFYGK